MKKLVAVLSILCFISFITIFKLESIFASSDNKHLDTSSSSNVTTYEEGTYDINSHEDLSNEKNSQSTIEIVEPNDDSSNISSSNTSIDTDVVEEYDLNENDINSENCESDEYSQEEEEVIVDSNFITKDEALNLLNSINPELTYEYKGDESTFTILKDKGLSGYVFLPNIDTDLGYFVDKNTSHIYYFHPSGYLELIK